MEFATLDWADWFNNRRLLEPIGNVPPADILSGAGGSGDDGRTHVNNPPAIPGRFRAFPHSLAEEIVWVFKR